MFILFFALWIILNGRITLELVLLGILIAAAVFLFLSESRMIISRPSECIQLWAERPYMQDE